MYLSGTSKPSKAKLTSAWTAQSYLLVGLMNPGVTISTRSTFLLIIFLHFSIISSIFHEGLGVK